MMKFSKAALTILACAALGMGMSHPAAAQDGRTCNVQINPVINVSLTSGKHFVSQSRSAFDIARAKSKKYGGVKMPMKLGNMGEARLKSEVQTSIKTYSGVGCLAIEKVDVQVNADYYIEIAKDYEEGSCMYSQFYDLENELMMQDEEYINGSIQNLRHKLRDEYGNGHNVYGPIRGLDIDKASEDKTEEIRKEVADYVATLEQQLFSIRKDSDSPEFFDDILKDCTGGTAQ